MFLKPDFLRVTRGVIAAIPASAPSCYPQLGLKMLSDIQIKKAKSSACHYKLPDERGLHLLVKSNGSKLWQLRYRHQGKEKTASLGQYPDVSLAEAREKREALRKLIAKGVDPMLAKQADKEAQRVANQSTFEVVARQWHEHWSANKHERHASYVLARLVADVFPAIGHRPIAQIQAPELVAMIKKIEARGALDISKRALQTTGQVFRYAIAHGLGGATRNPATDIKPLDVLTPRRKQNYARVDPKEFPALLRKMEAYNGSPITRLAMKLMSLTFVRTGELINAKWSEFDLDGQRWDIPAVRMKMRTAHIVPLSSQAVQVLLVLKEISGHREYLFPSERDYSKPMSNNTILGALKRMGYAGQMTGHGFRGLASTLLHEQGYDHQHIELQLAHQERNSVSAAYNHAIYLAQRTRMMQDWGDFVELQARSNVLKFERGVA